jgi:hypothetical protein
MLGLPGLSWTSGTVKDNLLFAPGGGVFGGGGVRGGGEARRLMWKASAVSGFGEWSTRPLKRSDVEELEDRKNFFPRLAVWQSLLMFAEIKSIETPSPGRLAFTEYATTVDS